MSLDWEISAGAPKCDSNVVMRFLISAKCEICHKWGRVWIQKRLSGFLCHGFYHLWEFFLESFLDHCFHVITDVGEGLFIFLNCLEKRLIFLLNGCSYKFCEWAMGTFGLGNR